MPGVVRSHAVFFVKAADAGCVGLNPILGADIPMNISKYEQRVLHALAQGGRIVQRRDAETGRVVAVDCFTRDGYVLGDCTMPLFRKLKRRRLISSRDSGPYRVTRLGLAAVRAQVDNR